MSQLEATAGLDLGDRYTHPCLIDTHSGEVIERDLVGHQPRGVREALLDLRTDPRRHRSEHAFSVGPSRLLESFGHEVLVANARKLRLTYGEGRKSDKLDAEDMARLARLDPKLLLTIEAPRRGFTGSPGARPFA